jgi:hypothetical protein
MKTVFAPNPLVPLVFALWILWGFGLETVARRLEIQLDGVVVSSRDVPSKGAPRYVTEYQLRGNDGQDDSYVAGPTDASLPRSLPTGTHLTKRLWHLDYQKDGVIVNDFPVSFYSITLSIAFACLFWSFFLWRDRRRSKHPISP